MTDDVRVVPVDPHDDEALRHWYAVETASLDADRPQATRRSLDRLTRTLRDPSPRQHAEVWAAQVGGRTVGSAELSWGLLDNTHLADVELHVDPTHRRRGIGRALLNRVEQVTAAAGCTTLLGEVHSPLDRPGPGMAFAERAGFASVHVEHHLVLDLSAPGESGRHAGGSGVEIVVWRDHCPDEHVEGFARMRTRMDADVPIGDVAYEPVQIDVAQVRLSEQRLRPDYTTVVAAAAATTDARDRYAGYSLVFVPHNGTDVLQDDTLVMPEHRGHRLGHRLKQATLEVVRRDFPGRTAMHTYTDPENQAMYRTNERFGYRAVEVMHEMQRGG